MDQQSTFMLSKGLSYAHYTFVICRETNTARVYKLYGSNKHSSISEKTTFLLSDIYTNAKLNSVFSIPHDVDIPVELAREFWKILVKHYGYLPTKKQMAV